MQPLRTSPAGHSGYLSPDWIGPVSGQHVSGSTAVVGVDTHTLAPDSTTESGFHTREVTLHLLSTAPSTVTSIPPPVSAQPRLSTMSDLPNVVDTVTIVVVMLVAIVSVVGVQLRAMRLHVRSP